MHKQSESRYWEMSVPYSRRKMYAKVSAEIVHCYKAPQNKTLAQVFFGKFCKISKNTLFTEPFQMTASVSLFLSLYSFLHFPYELLLPVALCSNSSFHVGAMIFSLLFLYCCLMFFHM